MKWSCWLCFWGDCQGETHNLLSTKEKSPFMTKWQKRESLFQTNMKWLNQTFILRTYKIRIEITLHFFIHWLAYIHDKKETIVERECVRAEEIAVLSPFFTWRKQLSWEGNKWIISFSYKVFYWISLFLILSSRDQKEFSKSTIDGNLQ